MTTNECDMIIMLHASRSVVKFAQICRLRFFLTHLGGVTHIYGGKLGRHRIRHGFVACLTPSHYLNNAGFGVNWANGINFRGFESKHNNFRTRKSIWKCLLQYGVYFASVSLYYVELKRTEELSMLPLIIPSKHAQIHMINHMRDSIRLYNIELHICIVSV